MKITRREAAAALALMARRGSGQSAAIDIAPGPFEPSGESFRKYQVPAWFRDAKFGIWAHWGPQSAPEQGDWYARHMYEEGSRIYNYHVQNFGHPSKVGYKDVVGTWKADRFDADHLVSLYKQAGAKYFVSLGVHHDNFDLWNSKYQPRWNALATGPKKDIVGLFQKAAAKQGLKFGVSDHLWISYKWLAISKASDKQGPLAGISYDGNDPQNFDLYHDADAKPLATARLTVDDIGISEAWKQHYFLRIRDMLSQYQPDLWYTDGPLAFGKVGLSLLAHHYNLSARKHGGKPEVVYTGKMPPFVVGKVDYDCDAGMCVLDLERGVANGIMPNPWQTDTCIGNWHYQRGITYKTPKTVVDMLVDIVSRNGNLLLNFPLPNNGELDPQELGVLSGITDWMRVNSEGIHGTRPWKMFGTGPGALAKGGEMSERNRKPLTGEDVRFTTKGKDVYAFVMDWPGKEAFVSALAGEPVRNVEMLGFKGKLDWKLEPAGLRVQMPAEKPCDQAVALKIAMA